MPVAPNASPGEAPAPWGRLGWLALAIVALAAGLRFWGLTFGLPHLEARPDETETLRLTLEAAAGRFDFDWAVYPHAYATLQWAWGELGLIVSSALRGEATPSMQTVWEQEPERLYAIGRGLSALAGTVTVAGVLVLTRRECGPWVAAVAGLWLAVNLLHVRESHSLKPDALLGLGLTACLAAGAALARRPGLRAGMTAGVAVGAAGAMKYNGVLGALPVAVGAWFGAAGRRGLGRWLPRTLVVAGFAAVASFWLFNPLLPFNETARDMVHGAVHAVFPEWFSRPDGPGWDQPIAVEGPGVPSWLSPYGAFAVVVYHCAFSLWHGAGALASLAAPFAVVWGLCSRNALLVGAAALVLGWLAVISASPVTLSRYLTPALPALAILQGAALCAWVERLASRRRALWVALGTVALLAQPLWASVRFDRLAARDDTRVQAAEWLSANAAGARVAIVGTRFWHYGEPRLPRGVRRVPLAPGGSPDRRAVDYVVTHDHELFWSTLPRDFDARVRPRLELLVDLDPRVGGAGTPVFESNDAFYLPIAGFDGVSLPGPHVRIYRVR